MTTLVQHLAPRGASRSDVLRRGITAAAIAVIVAGCAQQQIAPEPPATPPPPATAPAPPAPEPAPPPSAPAKSGTAPGDVERGRVSLYGEDFAGKATANGDTFDPNGLTMAHRTLPFGTRVRVTNLENQRSVVVTVNDRGPFVAGRIADLSLGAARQLGMVASGVVDAVLEVLAPGSGRR